ncbi:DUF3429 domain-containing protein [Lichenihabitans sp. Uapishka_5]|uniref:DUF3429 domain-containing protein n=1 Tax=Lichenihabitans sp. Uapishka_5 TaxID=3037302 RepID=UPI0029E7DEB4|nr:DUF3429 domain-containing protein [Lichenihabitans sp. Uapishka_5]MDX7950177.1 DUF3429 domain-containing protein [Lichenihabitans sp. Uapishka_5]
MMKSDDPWLPFSLGFAGLIPFWGLALAHGAGVPLGASTAAPLTALATYAATVLSFLGGIRWGLAIRTDNQSLAARDYAASVIPQILGWAALALADPWRLVTLAGLLVVLGLLDHDLVTRGMAPAWFGRLRFVLSVGAGAALLLAASG